jgi:LPS-assembly lipoprotein
VRRAGDPCGRRAALAGIAGLGLAAACGFQPIYAPGSPAAAMEGRVAVPALDGLAGFTLQERLTERLGVAGPEAYRLAIDLDFERADAAITQDNITTRFLVLGEASFRLYPPGGTQPVLADSVRSQTGYSAPESDVASAYAARIAGVDAERRVARELADRIVMRLALTADEWLKPAPGAPA